MKVRFRLPLSDHHQLTKTIDDALPIAPHCGVIPYEGGPCLVCITTTHDLVNRSVVALLTSNREILGHGPFSVDEFLQNGWELLSA